MGSPETESVTNGVLRNEGVKTLKKIQKVKAMLEQSKKMDESQQRMEQLQGVV